MTGLDVMWVGLGGGIGACLRWFFGKLIAKRYSGSFPAATFFMNITGAFVIAYLSVSLGVSWHDRYGSIVTALVLTGVLGGYTTFSTMQFEAFKLSKSGKPLYAFFYLLVSASTGLLAAAGGATLAHL